MNANTLLVPALLSLTLVGCGTVVEPGAPDPTGLEVANPDEPAIDGRQPVVPSPLLIEAPRAATTAQSLFGMTFLANAPLSNVMRHDARFPADVVEQRIVTATDEEIRLVVELAAPTGTFSRVIVSDVIRFAAQQTNHVLCEDGNIATFDPRCERTVPATRQLPSEGAISAAQWNLRVLDEATNTPVGSCIAAGGGRVECVLPARASSSYKIVAAASGFEDLWDGSPGLAQQIQGGVPFTGAYAAQRDYQCWDWAVVGTRFYCTVRYEYLRFNAVDRARLDFDPISLRITANGSASEMASPALTWDAGDAKLPGDDA